MKKFIFIFFIAIIGIKSAAAQNISSLQYDSLQNIVDSLINKVNVLQHNFDFLELSFKLESKISELNRCLNGLNISANGIYINLVDKNIDADLYISYRENYDSSIKLLETHEKSVKVLKSYLIAKMLICSFNEDERTALLNSYNVLNASYNAAEAALKHMKIILNVYKKRL